MNKFRHTFLDLLQDDSGQDLVEYALIVALVSLGSVTAMNALTTTIKAAFAAVGAKLTASV